MVRESMPITLTPEQEAWCIARVAAGDFASVEEAARQLIDERIAERAVEEGNDLAWAKPYVDDARAAVVVGFKCAVFGGICGQLVNGHSHGLGLARRKGDHWPLDGEIPSVLGPDRLQLRAHNVAQIDRSGRVHHQKVLYPCERP